jgi:beta-1,4-mannosyltransferase
VSGNSGERMRATVIVLGDVGRSPRMQYHALAVADHDIDVDIVALKGTEPLRALRGHPRVRLHLLAASEGLPRLSTPAFIARPVARAIAQGPQLMRLLWLGIERPDTILVQNPPAIPVLMIAMLYARKSWARLVIDWHNFGYAMLAMRLGARHPWVRLMKMVRGCIRALCRRPSLHIIRDGAGIGAHAGGRRRGVLYDRPAQTFRPTRVGRSAGAAGTAESAVSAWHRQTLVDVPGARVRLATPDVLHSTFNRLMYLDGRYEQLFEKIHDETGFGGNA